MTTDRGERSDNEMVQVLQWIYWLPLASESDLAGFGEFGVPKIHSLLERAIWRRLVTRDREGRTYGVKSRYLLQRRGVELVRTRFREPLAWQVTAAAQQNHMRRLRLYEPVNRLAPRLFRSGAVRTPTALAMDPSDDPRMMVFDEATRLVNFTWNRDLSHSPADAIAQYRTRDGDLLWIPFICVGLHHGEIPRPAELSGLFDVLDAQAGVQHGLTPAAPLGIGHPPGAVKAAVTAFEAADLVVRQGGSLYLTREGRIAAARRDREHPKRIHDRFAAYTNPGSPYAGQQRGHDRAVARIAALFLRAGIAVYHGWRLEVNYSGLT